MVRLPRTRRRGGVAGLNIDGSRIGTEDKGAREGGRRPSTHEGYQRPNKTMYQDKTDWEMSPSGRWPANLLLSCSCDVPHDDSSCPVRLLDEQSGVSTGRNSGNTGNHVGYSGSWKQMQTETIYRDTGGASRFFYVAKASRAERGQGNTHPTCKPVKLMEYLCALTRTPFGGVVLDPFLGSGTTGIAAMNTGRDFIGIELEPDYIEIARRRIEHAQGKLKAAAAEVRQLALAGD